MKKIIFIAMLGFALTTQAAEFTVLAGAQFNNSFEASDTAEVESLPDVNAGNLISLDSGLALGLELDFVLHADPDQRVGFFLSHHQTEFNKKAGLADSDLDISHLHLVFKNYYPQGDWEHFVLGGIGGTFYQAGDSSLSNEERFSASLGLGTNYPLGSRVLLRGEARWIGAFFDSEGSIFCSDGCVISARSGVHSQFQVNIGLMFR